jgi:hypothetical protein
MADDDFDDLTDEEHAALDWLMSDAGRAACAEAEAEAARRSKGGRRPKSSAPGKSGKDRKAEFDRRQRRLAWADDYTKLAGRLPRQKMDELEESRIRPGEVLTELEARWERDVVDWELITGLPGGPKTKGECLALQAWRHEREGRPPAPPPRNFPTARYEEPWLRRIEKQVRCEHTAGDCPNFPIDYRYRQALKRALSRKGPVKDLKLRSGGKRPAVTAYAAGSPRTVEPTPELCRAYLEQLARLKKRARRRRK